LEAFVTASLSLGPGKVTEFEVALKAKLASTTQPATPSQQEEGTEPSGEAEDKEVVTRVVDEEELVKLVEAHMERCFAKSMMILSELSASSVEVFLRVGESYLAENQKKSLDDASAAKEKEGEGQDLLSVHYHILFVNLLKKLFGAEVAQLCSSFAESLNKIVALGKEALPKKQEGEGEGEPSSAHEQELDNKVRAYVQDIYTNYAAKCHSYLHDASKQLLGVCQLLLLKHAAKA